MGDCDLAASRGEGATGDDTARPPRPLYAQLYVQVLTAILAGVLLGHFRPDLGVQMKPLGDAFIALVKLIIAPVIFVTVVHGIASMGDLRKTGRVGLKALIYFEIVTTLALAVGLLVSHLLQPGAGMNVDPATLDVSGIESYVAKANDKTSFYGALLQGNMLVLLIALVCAFALSAAGGRGKPIVDLVGRLGEIVFKIVGYIMLLAPIGAFGAMAFTIGKYGIEKLSNLAFLMFAFYATCLIFIFIVLGLIARALGFSILRFIVYLKDELLIVLGTSSSESALPRLISKLQKLGCEERIVGLVVPAGYSFNLDGTCIYLTMAALFLAQATNTEMTLWHQIGVLTVLLLTSKGAAGVTGSGFITLAATLSSVGHIPVAAMALILGVDRFMSEARALTNIIGNGVATIAIAKWENALDEKRLARELGAEVRTGEPQRA